MEIIIINKKHINMSSLLCFLHPTIANGYVPLESVVILFVNMSITWLKTY